MTTKMGGGIEIDPGSVVSKAKAGVAGVLYRHGERMSSVRSAR
jgi:hypothetical protein